MPSPLVCDFCSKPVTVETAWDCPARDFDAGIPVPHRPGFNHHSHGGWCACETCVTFVRSGRRRALTAFSVQKLIEREPDMRRFRRELMIALGELHDDFWSHREGEPRRVDPIDFAIAEAAPAQFEDYQPGPARVAGWVQNLMEGKL